MFEGALRVSAHSHTVLRLFFRRLGFLPLGFNPLRFPLKRLYEFFCGLGRRKVNISGCAKGVPDHAPGIVYPVAVFFLPPERTGGFHSSRQRSTSRTQRNLIQITLKFRGTAVQDRLIRYGRENGIPKHSLSAYAVWALSRDFAEQIVIMIITLLSLEYLSRLTPMRSLRK